MNNRHRHPGGAFSPEVQLLGLDSIGRAAPSRMTALDSIGTACFQNDAIDCHPGTP